jgi:hypothetical protein
VIIDMGYAVNHTDDFPVTTFGFGLAYGLCHTLPIPENWLAIRLASASMDCSLSQST